MRTERPQAAREHGGGRDAVEVEVAEHEDTAVGAHDLLQRVSHLGQPGYGVGVEPIAVERGLQEAADLGGLRYAARDERRGHETWQTESALDARDGGRVGRLDVELGRHGRSYLTCEE